MLFQMDEESMSLDCDLRKASVNDLPEEILEFVFMKLSPYRDLKAASLVCHLWNRLVQGK